MIFSLDQDEGKIEGQAALNVHHTILQRDFWTT
jgi:hypothetical protein